MKKIKPIVKCQGNKNNLSSWIIEHFPEDYRDLTYCELFAGTASVFFQKEPSIEEVLNDIDEGLVQIIRAIRDEPKEFINRTRRTKYTERAFKMALNRQEKGYEDYVENAVNEYILRRMSRGESKVKFANANDQNGWKSTLDQVHSMSNRLGEKTVVTNHDFFDVFKKWDEEETLFYVDPPEMPDSRMNKKLKDNELSTEQHVTLLEMIKNARGKVVISHSECPIYKTNLKGWKCKKTNVSNKYMECVWFNY